MADSYSENKRSKRKRKKLILNDKVEVRSVEDGFQGSWHPGTVIACEYQVRKVRYDHILCDDNSGNFVGVVGVTPYIEGEADPIKTQCDYRGNIRPMPPHFEFGKYCLNYGLCVDAWYNEAWWEGVIFDQEDGSEERTVFFPDIGDEIKIGIDMLRITRDWDEATENWVRRGDWLFLELIEELEQECPLFVSVKQIWYDLQTKMGFRRVKEWTSSSNRSLWKKLLLEAVNDNLELTVDEVSRVLNFSEDLVLGAQPLLELPETALDDTFEHEADLAKACEIPANNNWVSNGIQPIEDEQRPNELTLIMDDDGTGMNNSNMSCNNQESRLQHQDFSLVMPYNIDQISSGSFNFNFEDYSSMNPNLFDRKPTPSTRTSNKKWLPAGPDIVPGAEFCPCAVTEYALASLGNKRSDSSLTTNVRKHLAFLGWKIEFMREVKLTRMRYTSPCGKTYLSLRQVCLQMGELAKTLSVDSPYDRRILQISSNDLPSSLHPEHPQMRKEATTVELPPFSDFVVFEPEYCPQAVVDMSMLEGKNVSHKWRDLILKAKKHLSAVGWVFWYVQRQGRRELRFRSPRGKCYYSLRTACKGCISEGGVSEYNATTCRPIKSLDVREALLASDHLSSAVINMEFEGSLEAQYFPSEKRLALSHSDELNVLAQPKARRIRKSTKRGDNDKLHLVLPTLQSQALADSHAKLDGLGNALKRDRKRRTPKVSNAHLHKSKRKVSEPLIKLRDDVVSSCLPRVLRSSKRVRKVAVPSSLTHSPRTVLSWLIDNNVMLPREKVQYRDRKDHSLAEGRITRDGIKCSCCSKVFTLSAFEAHAGSTYRQPAANTFLADGRSLLDCQMQMLENNIRGLTAEIRDRSNSHRHLPNNDYICSVCHYGGELILCDQCPSSFHKACIGLKDVPEGDWFCPSCCCGFCGNSKYNENSEHHMDDSFVNCDQCEHQYHVGCARKRGQSVVETSRKGNRFCSKSCKKVFHGLQKLLGKPVAVGVDNLTWTLLKSSKYNGSDSEILDIEGLTESCSKLNVALGVMHECFEPVKEPRTKTDLVEDVIFSRWSDLKRLNFQGFYTVLLEKNDELISVATVRVFGKKVAEVPLVGTRFQYRRLGMCRILLKELEKRLIDLGVERLMLPAVPCVLNTWTTSFGFSKMTDSERSEFLDYTFLDFQDTVMCQKFLRKNPSTKASLSKRTWLSCRDQNDRSADSIDIDGHSAVSEVFQAERIEESEIVDQGSVDISVGNCSIGSIGLSSPILAAGSQLTDIDSKPWCGGIFLEEGSDEDSNSKEGQGSTNKSFKYYYKRRKVLASGS